MNKQEEIRKELWRIKDVLACSGMAWEGIYSLAEKSGLWYFRGGKAGSGNYGFVNLLTKTQTTIFHRNRDDMYVLAKSWVALMPEMGDDGKFKAAEKIPLPDVIEYMEKLWVNGKLSLDLYMKNDAQAREIMKMVVPDYDPDEFKTYHMRKIWKWFLIIHQYVEEIRRKIEREMDKESKKGEDVPQPSDV